MGNIVTWMAGARWAEWRDGLAYLRDAPGTLFRLARRGPGPQALRVGALRLLLVHRPEDLVELLEHDREGWPKAGLGRAEAVIGQGLLTSRGAHHDRQRHLAEAAFAPEQVSGLGGSWRSATERQLAAWRSGPGDHEVFADLRGLSARCISEAIFGPAAAGESAAVEAHLAACLAWLNRYPEPLAFLDALPSSARGAMRRARTHLRGQAQVAWTSGRGGPLLAPLRAAGDARGQGMDREAAIDELLTFLIAAYEPTAVALAWALWRLARHPDWQQRLADEARAAVAAPSGSPSGGPAGRGSDSARSPLLRAFLAECLRLHPPIWVVARRAPGRVTLGGQQVAPGTWLMVSPWVTQRGPAFADAEDFRPERWLDGEPPPGAFLPFGWGPRRCLGEGLAMGLMTSFLDHALQGLRFAPARSAHGSPGAARSHEPALPAAEATITLRPKGGLWLELSPR